MTTLAVRAFGRPAPQGSHELGANGHVMHSSNYLAGWRRQVEIAALTAYRDAGVAPGSLPVFRHGVPVYVHELTLIVTDEQCRAAGTDEPVGRPDVDKLLRATIDGLGDARMFLDDSQITKIYELSKVRPWADEPSGAIIVISDEPREAAVGQGESMTEYRISLERVTGRDEDGFRITEGVFELYGTESAITGAGLTSLAALLGAGEVSVSMPEPSAAAAAAPAEPEAPRKSRGRPRKSEAASAPQRGNPDNEPDVPDAPSPGPQPAPDSPTVPEVPTTPDEPQTPPETPAAPARVNPFA